MSVMTLEEAMGTRVPIANPVPRSDWPEQINHLSATSLGMFSRCPEQWRRRYICGEKARPAAALVWGSADHTAIGWGLEQKIQTGTLPSSSDVMDRFAQAWTDSVDGHGGESEVAWADDAPGDLKTKAATLTKTYHEQESPLIDPVGVEQEFRWTVDGVPVPLVGFIDVVTPTTIIERKTSKRRESKPKPDWVVQARIYSMVLSKPVAFHISTKTAKPAVYTPATDPALLVPKSSRIIDSYVQRLASTLSFYASTLGTDEAWPGAITHPWACSYCSYQPSCAWWAE